MKRLIALPALFAGYRPFAGAAGRRIRNPS